MFVCKKVGFYLRVIQNKQCNYEVKVALENVKSQEENRKCTAG